MSYVVTHDSSSQLGFSLKPPKWARKLQLKDVAKAIPKAVSAVEKVAPKIIGAVTKLPLGPIGIVAGVATGGVLLAKSLKHKKHATPVKPAPVLTTGTGATTTPGATGFAALAQRLSRGGSPLVRRRQIAHRSPIDAARTLLRNRSQALTRLPRGYTGTTPAPTVPTGAAQPAPAVDTSTAAPPMPVVTAPAPIPAPSSAPAAPSITAPTPTPMPASAPPSDDTSSADTSAAAPASFDLSGVMKIAIPVGIAIIALNAFHGRQRGK